MGGGYTMVVVPGSGMSLLPQLKINRLIKNLNASNRVIKKAVYWHQIFFVYTMLWTIEFFGKEGGRTNQGRDISTKDPDDGSWVVMVVGALCSIQW